MSETIRFTLDGREIDARPGETILQAAERHGTAIPHLCYTEGMRADGNCRACVVEIDGERVLAPSCCRFPVDGMKVTAQSDRARRSQRMVLELLLADAPASAYDPASELSEWADFLGVHEPRFAPSINAIGPVFEPDFSHPAIGVRLDACIQCTRCVRACREVQVNDVIGYAGRGAGARIVFDQADPMGESTCVACGECVRACPTGALLPSDTPLRRQHGEPPRIAPGASRSSDGDGTHAPHSPAAAPPLSPIAMEAPRTSHDIETGDPPSVPSSYGLPLAPEAGFVPAAQVASFDGALDTATPPLVQLRANRAPHPAPELVQAPDRSVPTLCPYCGVGCQLTYHVKDERIVRAEGRDGPSNHGRLCVKGRFGFDYVRHPQRLTVPLIRRDDAPKDAHRLVDPGNPLEAFREATWEEALERAASGLRGIRDTLGPQALAGYGSAKGSNEEAYLFQKLVRTGFGTNNVDHCTRLCHASSVAALMEGLGSAAVSNPVADVQYCDVFMIIGANPTVNHPVAATFMKNAIERGARLILADPRRTELARLATYHLGFRPGTDVALLNAMLHTIIDEELYDARFIEARTEGFEALRKQLRAYAPELMEEICGIPAWTIRDVARLYATSKGSMIFWGMGVSQHTHGTDNARCLIALALITGQIGRRGAGLHPLRGQNNVQGASDVGLIPMVYPDYQRVDDPEKRAFFERLWGTKLDPKPGLTVVEILNACYDRRIRGMYIMGENPAMSDPDVQHARESLAQLDHLVVQDIFLTETAALADVVLPASAFAEKWGTFTNTDRRVQLARAAIPLPGRARQDLELIQEIARRIGLDWSYRGPADVWAEIRQACPSMAGITWERLEREHGVTYPCTAEGDPGEEVVFTGSFPTATGKGKLVPVDFTPAAEVPDAEYPYVLITGRLLEHWHTGAMTRRAEVLDAIEPVPAVSLRASTMRAIGVRPGDLVTLETRRGSLAAIARHDEGVPADAAFLPFCFVEAAANILTNPALDPYGKIPEFKYCALRLRAGGEPLEPAGYGIADELVAGD